MHPELTALMELQAIDVKMDQCRAAISKIPASIEKEKRYLTGFESSVEALEGEVEAARKKLREAEGEIQSFDQKLRDTRGKQTLVKTNEEYRALGAEIEGFQNRISALEDTVLEVMESMPGHEEKLAEARGELETARGKVQGEVKKYENHQADFERELGELLEKSKTLAGGVSGEWMERYRNLRKSRKGLAVCAVVNRTCQGCRMAETIKRFLEIRDSGDRIYTCSNCKRILYYQEGESVELSLPAVDAGSGVSGVDVTGYSTKPGFVNRNNQKVIRRTGAPGNDHYQYVYVLQCGDCSYEYGSNGSDNHQRKCPRCQKGAPGLAY